jgi:hypothetical protein
MCAFQIFAKAAATALIAVTDSSWLWYARPASENPGKLTKLHSPRSRRYYVVGDYGLYFAYFVARRDLVFFLPMPTAASYATSPLFRAICKVCTDFTGSPHFRLPVVCGGSYYAFCLASSQASVFAAVYVYTRYATLPEGVEKIEASILWAGASLLAGAWLCAFLFFAFRIAVPKYVRLHGRGAGSHTTIC